jgi:hypothetical protein
VRQPVFAIRQRPHRIFTLSDYENTGILTEKGDELNRHRHRDDALQSIQPTIRIPVGYRFNVRVNRDILFEAAYTPMEL